MPPPTPAQVEVSGSDPTCLTFTVRGEGHTLGNAVRYVLVKNPDVEFAGYSIPHPSDDFVNIRVQTLRGVPAVDAFRKALRDLALMSAEMRERFVRANEDVLTQ